MVKEQVVVPTSAVSPDPPRAPSPPPPPQAPAAPVPDGGWEAWLVVFGAMVSMVHTWGLISSFGVFQTYYETQLLAGRSSSDISWIGSVQAALMLRGGLFVGPLADAGFFRELVLAGTFLICFGMFMTSLCTRYYQVLLAQGVCVGLGCAALFLPSVAILSQWFARRRALALGVQSVGSPVAGIVLPIIFGRLQPTIGFGWTTRVIAFILAGLSISPVVFVKPRVPRSAHTRAFYDSTYFKDLPMLLFSAASFFSFLGLYVPFFYLQLYGISYRVSSDEFSPYFVTLLNVGSICGRLVTNYIAVFVEAPTVLIFVLVISAALALAWLGISNFGGLVAFALLYGAFSGGGVTMLPSAVVPYCPDPSRLGTRMGMNFMGAGVSVLIGTPIGGAILRHGGKSAWKGIIAYTGVMIAMGAILFTISYWLLRRRVGMGLPESK